MSDIKKLKSYDSYEDYVNHQKEKTLDPVRREKWLNQEWNMKIGMFTETFKRHSDIVKGKALCVCARMGQEVAALNAMGVDAIGIDLVEYPPLVITGDMHNLDFEDDTFDFIFSNSFDHSLEPDKMISEIERVLKPGGHALLQFQFNVADNYAETILPNIEPVLKLIKSSEVVKNAKIPQGKYPIYNWEVAFKYVPSEGSGDSEELKESSEEKIETNETHKSVEIPSSVSVGDLPLKDSPSSEWNQKYSELMNDDYLRRKYDRTRRINDKIEYVNEFIPEVKTIQGKVLDIGPGPGEFLEVCRAFGNEVRGIDAKPGESEMGDEYLELSRMMAERQEIPIDYYGAENLVSGGLGEDIGDEEYDLINSQGAIEQVARDYLIGVPTRVHKDCRRLSWDESEKTEEFLTNLFKEFKRILKVGGICLIYGNGAKNPEYYDRVVRSFCKNNDMELLYSKDSVLHKIRRIK